MVEILSLSRLRKARTRAEAEARAAANRAKYGRTKLDKQREATEQARLRKAVEAHKRED